MGNKGFVVLEHSDGSINGCHIFVGKNAKHRAQQCFVKLVVADMKAGETDADAEEPSADFDEKEALKEATRLMRDGYSYTSASEDTDIMIVSDQTGCD